jgi:hypothetical protein
VRFAKHDHVVETFAVDRANESLNVSILPGRSGCDRLVRMPIARIRCKKTGPCEVSGSRMRYRGAWSHGNASVTWREIHSPVGFFVMIFGALSPHPKIPFPGFEREVRSHRTRNSDFWAALMGILDRRGSYSGLSPSAADCRLHSVGGSRGRSMPMPRGRAPPSLK